jgi:WD40 repeat protein
VGAPLSKIAIYPNGSKAAVATQDGRFFFLVDLTGGVATRKNCQIEHAEFKVSDIAISPDMRFVYFAGKLADDSGLVVRFDTKEERCNTILLLEPVKQPSIAAGENGKLYFVDPNQSSIQIFDDEMFKGKGRTSTRSLSYNANIFLKTGPAFKIALSSDQRSAFVSHWLRRSISLINLQTFDTQDTLSWDAVNGSVILANTPISIFATGNVSTRSLPVWSSLIAGDPATGTLAIFDHDATFESLSLAGKFEAAQPNFELSSSRIFIGSPMLISSDNTQQKIVVGHRMSRHISVYKRSGLVFEKTQTIELDSAPTELAVSADGSIIAIIEKESLNQVWLISSEAGGGNAVLDGDSKVREAQRALAKLKFEIGVVNGVVGESTLEAIKHFQKQNNIAVTGSLDDLTTAKLMQQAAAAKEF